MFKRLSILGHTSQLGGHEPTTFVLVTLFVSTVLILKAPDFWPIVVTELVKSLQYFDMNSHLHNILVLRCQAELYQNLATQVLLKGDLAPLDLGSRSLPFGMRIKNILVAAVCDVSVIIPTLNEEKYLPKCLESLVRQSRVKPAEIIVVDGGSKDQTAEVAREFTDNVLLEPNRPVGAARNAGARQAKEETLAFIDADTIASERWVEEIARTFGENPGGVGVTGPTLPYEGTQLDKLAYHVATGWAQRLSFRLGRPHVAGFNCAYRKDALWKAGGFDEYRVLSEDVMLSLRMRHQGEIVYNPQMIAYTSLRRIKRYGYPYLTTYYAINAATMLLFDRTLGYPQVR